MDQPIEPRPRRLKPSAIFGGAAIGIAGIPVMYVLLRAFGLIISDQLLLACAAAPTLVLLALAPRLRAWAVQAAIASALATVLVIVVVGGGIALFANMISDPRP